MASSTSTNTPPELHGWVSAPTVIDHEHLPVGGDLCRFELSPRGVVRDDGQVGPPGGKGREGGFPIGGDDVHPPTLPADLPDRLGDHPPQRTPASRDGHGWRGLLVQFATAALRYGFRALGPLSVRTQ